MTNKKHKEIFSLEQISNALNRGGREFEDKDDLDSEARDLYEFFDMFPVDSDIKVYRVVHALSETLINVDELGSHWTHSEFKAKDFATDNLSKPWFLISGTVSHDSINWPQTLFQNIHHPHEEELYLKNSGRLVKKIKIKQIA